MHTHTDKNTSTTAGASPDESITAEVKTVCFFPLCSCASEGTTVVVHYDAGEFGGGGVGVAGSLGVQGCGSGTEGVGGWGCGGGREGGREWKGHVEGIEATVMHGHLGSLHC